MKHAVIISVDIDLRRLTCKNDSLIRFIIKDYLTIIYLRKNVSNVPVNGKDAQHEAINEGKVGIRNTATTTDNYRYKLNTRFSLKENRAF